MRKPRSKSAQFVTFLVIAAQISLTAGHAATRLSDDFWVSTSTNTLNLGTLSDPYNASTQVLFDKVMADLPPNCTVHLLSGTYQTLGTWQARVGGWPQVKSGQKIVGAGIDHSIIHFCRTGTGSYSFGNAGIAGTNIEISDLTIDGAGTTNCCGVMLFGDHLVVRRVKVINLSSKNAEIFPIVLLGGPGPSGGRIPSSEGNLIEQCEVNLPNITWVSGICLSGNPTNYASGAIRNNRVILGAFKPDLPLAAFNCGYAHDLLVEGNYVEGGDWGFYAEAGFTNLMIHHNTLKNVAEAVNLFILGSTNVTCSFNTITLAASPKDTCAFAFRESYAFRNLVLLGNTIQFAGAPALRNNSALAATSASGLSFINNILDRRLLITTKGSTGVSIYNNVDLDGNPLPLNQELSYSIARTSVTSAGAYLVQSGDRYIGIKNTSLTTVFLPPASGLAGKEFVIVREDGGESFVLTSRGGLINGTNNLAILKSSSSPAANTTVISDGSNWFTR